MYLLLSQNILILLQASDREMKYSLGFKMLSNIHHTYLHTLENQPFPSIQVPLIYLQGRRD